MADNERQKALDAALQNLTKRFGDGTILRLGDTQRLDVAAISSGSLALDMAIGIGGLPKGRITEIYGPESAGKTTLCLHVIAEAQRQGGLCAFIDMEHALDSVYAGRIGIDVNRLYVTQPDYGEQALEICEALVRSGVFAVIVLDSVAALVPKAEIEGEMGDNFVGMQARLMSQALRKLSGAIKHADCVMIFTNQLREKIGVMYGNPEVTTGGRALKFYSSVRLEIRRIQGIKDGLNDVGNRTRVRVIKNKVAPPFREAEFDIMFDEGISRIGDMLDLAVALEIIEKRGAYFRYQETSLGQGREAAKAFLKQNAAVASVIENLIRARYGLPALA